MDCRARSSSSSDELLLPAGNLLLCVEAQLLHFVLASLLALQPELFFALLRFRALLHAKLGRSLSACKRGLQSE